MRFHPLLVLLALVGCKGKGDDSASVDDSAAVDDSTPSDEDEDGFAVGDDCDDGNPEVNPDATELCDGIDNDCDGTTDVGASDATEHWSDGDADGYGAGASAISCAAAGAVENGDDCDDTDPAVNPAASEVCDDLDTDEDCDTLADDDDDSVDPSSMTSWYVDADADGYGDAATTTTACDLPSGYAAASGDCNEGDDAINPGVSEVCGDTVDDNCNGSTVDGCPWIGSYDSTDAGVTISPAVHIGGLGSDTVSAGDTNADGYGDLLVGTSSGGDVDAMAYLFLGPVSSMDADAAAAQIGADPATPRDYTGFYNLGVGDQDGDGFDDILITAFAYSDFTGKVYVILGPVSGTSTADVLADATITGDTTGGWLGWQPTSGDVTGDGVHDLVIGALNLDGGVGSTFVFFGPVTTGALAPADADASFAGDTVSGELTGAANSAAGDVDGDGVNDLLISAGSTDDGATNNGVDWIFYGPISGAYDVTDADVRVHGTSDSAHLGFDNSIGGDLDGDGLDDVATSAPDVNEGAVYLFYADTVNATADLDVGTADATVVGEELYEGFANDLDTQGDLDGDGADDFVAATVFHGKGDGVAYVFYCPISGTLGAGAADFVINGGHNEALGSAVGFVGDLNADGYGELAVGAYNRDGGVDLQGAVTLWYGAPLP